MRTTLHQAVEIIRLKVSPGKAAEFVAQREMADKSVGRLKGFISTELCHQKEEDWILFVRWESMEAVKEAQKITENMPEISAWIALASEFVSFDTVEVRRFFASGDD